MVRILAISLLGVVLSAPSIAAADENGAATLTPAVAVAASALAERPDLAAQLTFAPRAQAAAPRRPLTLPALYVGSAVLQGYDAYSTLSVLKHGGVEANPMMKGVTKSPVAFIGLKAGITAMSIMAAERMWKNNNRLGAVLTMVAANGVMGYVAAHNAKVLAQVR
jgi:hypothetical protein